MEKWEIDFNERMRPWWDATDKWQWPERDSEAIENYPDHEEPVHGCQTIEQCYKKLAAKGYEKFINCGGVIYGKHTAPQQTTNEGDGE